MKPAFTLALPIGLAIGLAGCSGEAASQAEETTPQSTVAEQSSAIRDVSVAEVDELLSQEGGVVVLDVRTAKEFEDGHIDGAVNIDFLSDDFALVLAELDRETTYVLHCKSGSRSMKALDVMREQGFTSIAHLTGGYDGWKAAQAAE